MRLEAPAYRGYGTPPEDAGRDSRLGARHRRRSRRAGGRRWSCSPTSSTSSFAASPKATDGRAVSHAHKIVDIEKAGGFFWEPAIQEKLVDHHAIITAANWMYIWGHWPLIACVAAWLMVKRPAAYSVFRNAFFISGTIGIIIFVLFPVAPPRLADVGVVDTVTMYSHSYRVLQPPAFVNQYAAVPSLHFGWDLLIGIALITQSRAADRPHRRRHHPAADGAPPSS